MGFPSSQRRGKRRRTRRSIPPFAVSLLARSFHKLFGERTRPRVPLAAPRRNLAPSAFNTLSDKRTPSPSARRRREHARARVLPMKCEISGLGNFVDPVSPHPNPLPWGEGALFADLSTARGCGFVQSRSAASLSPGLTIAHIFSYFVLVPKRLMYSMAGCLMKMHPRFAHHQLKPQPGPSPNLATLNWAMIVAPNACS